MSKYFIEKSLSGGGGYEVIEYLGGGRFELYCWAGSYRSAKEVINNLKGAEKNVKSNR